MTHDRPSRYLDQINLRLPDGMRERVKASATSHGRSMNAEIVHQLERRIGGEGLGKSLLVLDLARALGIAAEVSDRGVLLITSDAA